MGTLRELHPNPRFTKYLVEKIFFENDPLVIVDVGARKGFEKHWGHYGDQIKLIGFEPNKDSYKECVERKSNSQTTYYPYALDRHKGKKDFYVTSYSSASSFFRPNMTMAKKFGIDDELSVVKSVQVDTINFDSFQKIYGLENVDFIKLDTEGSELDILKGSENALKSSVLGLSIEVRFIEILNNQPLFSDIDRYLKSLGFFLYDLDLNRLTRNVLGKQKYEFGQLHFAQALYLREAVDEIVASDVVEDTKKIWDETKILKMASIMELFYLPDCAIELLQKSVDVGFINEKRSNLLIDLLVPDIDGKTLSYSKYLSKMNVKKQFYLKSAVLRIIKIFTEPIRIIIQNKLTKS